MSGSLVGGVVGAVIGFSFGNPQLGWMIGSTLGSLVDNKRNSGPDMTDLRPQASEYGRPIPIIYSVMAVGGNIIWASDLVKTGDGDGGGKGGGGGSSTGPTYAANFAVLICEGDGNIGLGRIWAGPDKRVVYDPVGQKVESGTIRFYDGAGDQMPDPLTESYLGAGNVPAYRGFAYVVFEGFDVSAHDGNRIPFLTIEVGRKGTQAPASLGQWWLENVWTTATQYVTAYNGSYYGELVHAKATMAFQHNWQIGNWGASDIKFVDYGRSRFVRRGGVVTNFTVTDLATGFVTTYPLSSGADVFTCGCMANGRYIFGTLSGKLLHVDPDTGTLLATQNLALSGGETLHALYSAGDSASEVYGATSSRIVVVVPNGTTTAVIDRGAYPPGFTYGTAGAIDPNTGMLWCASYSGGGVISWSVHDLGFGLVYSNSTTTIFAGISTCPWLFTPTTAWLCGTRWLAVDHFMGFDPPSGVNTVDEVDGGYHGIHDLMAARYDDATNRITGWRVNGLYAVAVGQDPSALPFQSGYLGGSDSSLQRQSLDEIVTDLSHRAGLTDSDIDVTKLTDIVDGSMVANQMACQDAVKALMPAFYFDAVESQGKVKFVKRGGAIVVEIPDDDLGAHPSGEEGMDLFDATRVMDEELPRTLSVNYVLAATKYSPATKYARRLVGYSGDEARTEFAMVFTDKKAQEIAEVNLHTAWVERLSFKFSLPLKYAYLEPTDIVGIGGYTMRITKMTQKGAIFDCEAVRDDSDTYTPHVIVTETAPPDETVGQPTLTLMELM